MEFSPLPMFAPFLITFREGFEAAVIIGILLSTLRMLSEQKRNIFVWSGAALGVIASLLLAWIFESFLGGFTGRAEQIYEGLLMLVAFLIITHMVIWLRRYGRNIQQNLEQKVKKIFDRKEVWALGALAFVAVLREGVETVIFLKALSLESNGSVSLWGALLGVVAAISLAAIIFLSTRRISPKRFFQVTGVLLVFIAAGLLAHSIGEFQEAGLLGLEKPLFDLSNVLSTESGIGSFLGLFGYIDQPSILSGLTYALYLAVIFPYLQKFSKKSA